MAVKQAELTAALEASEAEYSAKLQEIESECAEKVSVLEQQIEQINHTLAEIEDT